MANITGLITINEKEIIEVDGVPSASLGTPAPMGSLAMYDTGSVGELYLKTGAANTAWTKVDVPDNSDWNLAGNTLSGTEFIGSLNDQDIKFYRNNTERMRLVGSSTSNSALLVGLNATLGGRLQVGNLSGEEFFKMALMSGSIPQVIKATRMGYLTTSDGTPTSAYDIGISQHHNALVKVAVAVRQTGGISGNVGDGAMYERTMAAKNVAGTVTILKTQTDFTYEIVGSMNVSFTGGTNVISQEVKGVTDRDLSWGIYSDVLMTYDSNF